MNYLSEDQDFAPRVQRKAPLKHRLGKFVKGLARALTGWAWKEQIATAVKLEEANTEGWKLRALCRESQLAFLENLFREKQDKIKRLQDAYKARCSPRYEDMRLENPIKDAESLAQSVSVLATRAEAYRQRTGKPMRTSDGTVLGVPGDRPNDEVGPPWGRIA